MTCHTGPSGLSTFGRVGPRLCAAAGVAVDAANAAQEAKAAKATRRARLSPTFPNIDFIRKLSLHLFRIFISYDTSGRQALVFERLPVLRKTDTGIGCQEWR